MTLPRNIGIAPADQKIEIGAAVGLHHVLAVKLCITSLGRKLLRFPRFLSSFDFGFGNVEIKRPVANIKIDHVTVLDDAKRASGRGLGGDMQDYGAISRAAHPRV